MSTKRPQESPIKVEVACDKDTGHVFAARWIGAAGTGTDAPQAGQFIPGENEFCQEIEITREQAGLGLPELFASHRLKKGKLVPAK